MQTIDGDETEARGGYPHLIDVLDEAFRVGAVSPLRHHHQIPLEGRPDATLLLMPAWTASTPGAETAGRYAGVKMVTVVPDNGVRRALPAISGIYLLIETDTGQPAALIDGPRLTVLRTAAASALGARYLARPDTTRMTMLGAGALAPYLIRAHASVRPIREVTVWNRTRANADRMCAELQPTLPDIRFDVTEDLEAAVGRADLVSAATISTEPLIKGAWLSPGTHVDCVGAFRPDMRETDDDAMRRARVWVDTMVGGLNEAGDVVQAIASGALSESDIQGDLFGLARGAAPVRSHDDEVTLFKSVGASIEDLFAAIAIFEAGRGTQ